MLQYSVYSVISPEGCAAILWKTPDKAGAAAEAMGLTAQRLQQLGFVDDLVPEPLGGAHRDPVLMADTLRKTLAKQLKRLRSLDI
jgi:acetyl-CoA carboxylase carboxyl transferase subunit alpha